MVTYLCHVKARSTSTATVELDASGIVIARINPDVIQSTSNARENIAACVEAGGSVRRPLLVDISRCRPLEPEVRHFYSGKILIDSFLGLGLLIEASPLGRMMGNVYLRIARPGIPTQLFAEEPKARAWLVALLDR